VARPAERQQSPRPCPLSALCVTVAPSILLPPTLPARLQPLGIGLILGALLIILSFTQMKMPGYLRNWGAL
jgi:hypothetical protein